MEESKTQYIEASITAFRAIKSFEGCRYPMLIPDCMSWQFTSSSQDQV